MITELSIVALKVVHEFMKTRPDYEQRKRETFYKNTLRLEEQLLIADDDRRKDHDLIMNLRSQLKKETELFYKELKS